MKMRETNKLFSKQTLLGALVLLSLLFAFWWIYFTNFGGKLFVSNDGWEIPEVTQLNGKYVDNIDYINQHHLGGVTKYDPRKPEKFPHLIANQDYLSIANTQQLTDFINSDQNLHIWYEPAYHGLFSDGILTEYDRIALCAILDEHQCRAVNQYFKLTHKIARHPYNQEERLFLDKNVLEFGQQAMPGFYFHHQYSLYGSINEINLKRPARETSFLYGWLNTVALAAIMKHFGGFSFANYVKITYLFYPIYYSLIALVSLLLFRSFAYAIYVTAICMCSYFLIGFGSIFLAPGFIPIRHFFDLFVLATFYLYIFSESKRLFYLAITMLFSFLAVLSNKEFGLFILLGVTIAFAFKSITERKISFRDSSIVLAGWAAVILFILLFKVNGDPTSIYTMAGVLCPPMDFYHLRNYFLIFNFIYILLVFVPWRDNRWKSVAIYLFAYAQAMYVYYVWNTSSNHWYSIATTWIILSAILLQQVAMQWKLKKHEYLILFGLLVLQVSMHAKELIEFITASEAHKNIFKEHKLYNWDMPATQFISTMDPALFKESVQLIQKYSSSDGIYIISKYDNLIPFLANKYSLMPYEQLALSLVTNKEIQNATNAILQNKPEYLFVDSDIQINHRLYELSPENIPGSDTLHKRMVLLNSLNTVFELIHDRYKLLVQGKLISVYKKV